MTRVGVDLIEIERVRRSLERYEGFRDRCFTPAEQAYCDSRKNPAESYAGRFAGKEAVGKALGFGVARAFAWKDIEIAGRPKPSVRLSGRVAAWAERVDAGAIDLSMTHSRELASAVAVVTRCLSRSTRPTEARRAEEGHDVAELMERAGAAVAREVLQRFPGARGSPSSAAAARTAATAGSRRGSCASRVDAVETTAVEQADVIVDALFGTGFHG